MTELDVLGLLDETETEEVSFEAESRTAIRSTDVAKILGLSRYGSPLTVYRDKLGESEERPVSLPAWIGLRLETLVTELYSTSTGTPLRADDGFYRHPEFDWIGTHLDRRAVGDGHLIVELKTRSSARGWGDDGSADIPADIWTQVQVQAACVGAREVHVATLFSNSSFRVYRIVPDPAVMDKIIPILRTFWFDHVLAGVPPMATGSPADREILQRIGGGETGVMKAATPEQEVLVGQYRLARMNSAQANYALEEAENRIKQLIGEDADGLRGGFGQITWRRTKEVHKTEWELVAKVYRSAIDALLEMAAPGDDDAVVAEYALIKDQVTVAQDMFTTVRPGTRTFRPTFRED